MNNVSAGTEITFNTIKYVLKADTTNTSREEVFDKVIISITGIWDIYENNKLINKDKFQTVKLTLPKP